MRLKIFTYLAFFTMQSLYALTWMNDVDQALAIGAQESKPILIYFTGNWNTWCQKLDNQVINQSAFEKLGSEMILAKLCYPQNSKDHTKNLTRYRRTYQVYSYPTLLILSPEGKRLGTVGYPRDSVDEYIAKIRFLAGINDKPIHPPASDKKASEPSSSPQQKEQALPNDDDFDRIDYDNGKQEEWVDLDQVDDKPNEQENE